MAANKRRTSSTYRGGKLTSAHTSAELEHDPTDTRINRGSLAGLARSTAKAREATTHDAAKDLAEEEKKRLKRKKD